MRTFVTVSSLAVLALVGCSSTPNPDRASPGDLALARAGKVDVCHVTGSGSVHLVNVSESAVPAHLRHGDYLLPTWYADDDGDGFGDALAAVEDCEQPEGYVADATDCDDGDADVFPGADEWCDGVDQDCDGTVDEDALDATPWYGDGDGDGFGDPLTSVEDCDRPEGYVADATDCDDGDASVHPGATETCNLTDDDCDGAVDEGAWCDCAIKPRSSTVGLWCFQEGSGTTSRNRYGAAPDVTGIAPADWVSGGGFRPTTSTAQIPDDASLDLAPPYSVEVDATFTTLTSSPFLVSRVDWSPSGADAEQWVRLLVTSTGRIFCEFGTNNHDSYTGWSAVGTVVAPETATIGCSRSTSGDVTLFKNGAMVPTAVLGTPIATIVGEDQPIQLGYTNCPSSVCPYTPHRLDGVVRAVAIHAAGL